jgi:hypothetical protein
MGEEETVFVGLNAIINHPTKPITQHFFACISRECLIGIVVVIR